MNWKPSQFKSSMLTASNRLISHRSCGRLNATKMTQKTNSKPDDRCPLCSWYCWRTSAKIYKWIFFKNLSVLESFPRRFKKFSFVVFGTAWKWFCLLTNVTSLTPIDTYCTMKMSTSSLTLIIITKSTKARQISRKQAIDFDTLSTDQGMWLQRLCRLRT